MILNEILSISLKSSPEMFRLNSVHTEGFVVPCVFRRAVVAWNTSPNPGLYG